VGMALLGQDQSRAHCNFDGLKRHCHRSAVRSALQKRAAQKRLETKMMKSSKWLVTRPEALLLQMRTPHPAVLNRHGPIPGQMLGQMLMNGSAS